MDDPRSSSSSLHRLAIEAALNADWPEALRLNEEIIEQEPQSTEALNRLARVYMELGKFEEAKKIYQTVLKIDAYNPIASKNLKILKSSQGGLAIKPNGQASATGNQNGTTKRISAYLFLQEPGKTKVVSLLKVAEPQKLSALSSGMELALIIKNRKVAVTNCDGLYIGVLPDDVCHHLVRLIRGGNKYEVFVKAVKVNGLTVLIREVFRSKRFKNQPSFQVSGHSLSQTIIHRPIDQEEEDVVEDDGSEEGEG